MKGYIPCKILVQAANNRQAPKESTCYIKINQIVAIQQSSNVAYTYVYTTSGDVFHVVMHIGEFIKKVETASAR